MEDIKTKFMSELTIKNIFVSKTEFTRKEILKPRLNMSFDFEHEIIDIDKSNFKVVLIGRVESEDTSIAMSAAVTAFFVLESEDVESDGYKAMKFNSTIAIMFPYLRTQIAMVSSQSGVSIVVPAININAYFADKLKS